MSQNPSRQEQDDLIKLHADRLKLQANFSDSIRMYLELDETGLKHSGHKTNEGAVFWAAKNHIKEMNKLVQNHIKKYPD